MRRVRGSAEELCGTEQSESRLSCQLARRPHGRGALAAGSSDWLQVFAYRFLSSFRLAGKLLLRQVTALGPRLAAGRLYPFGDWLQVSWGLLLAGRWSGRFLIGCVHRPA